MTIPKLSTKIGFLPYLANENYVSLFLGEKWSIFD